MLKIALFLGAGTSVQFEKPTTKQFRDHMQNDDVQTSMFLDTLLGRSEFPDIEHVLQCVVDLLTLKNTYAGKYFEFSKTTTPSEDGKTYRFDQLMATAKNAEDVILTELFRKYRWNPVHDPDLKEFYDSLFTTLNGFANKIYLGTTNYDQAIEIFCNQSQKKYQCIDSFKLDERHGHYLWDPQSFDYNYEPEQGKPIFLYKIHGSLNWFHFSGNKIRRDLTEPDYEINTSGPHHVFVAPTLSPKDAEKDGPYRILRDEFVKQLKDCDVCIVIGFSFRDEVVATHFKDFVDAGKRLIIISPKCRETYCENLQKKSFESVYKRDEWLNEHTIKKSVHFIEKYVCKENNSDIVKKVSDILSK